MFDSNHSRRGFLMGALASPLALAFAACARSADQRAAKDKDLPAKVTIENFSAAGVSLGKVTVPRVARMVISSYSHSPRLSIFTSPKASAGPAISSNWKRGNSTIPTLILRIATSLSVL